MSALISAALTSSSLLLTDIGGRSMRRLRMPPPSTAALVAGASIGLVTTTGFLVNGVPAVLLFVVAIAVCRLDQLRRRRTQRQLRNARSAEVSAFCFAVGAELRAGRTPSDAVAAAAMQLPVVGPDVAGAAQAARLGASVPDELAVVAGVAGCERLQPVAAAWAATGTSGARVADLLERLASAFAAEDQVRAELLAEAAGPQATVVVLALLPLVAIALGSALGAKPVGFLVHTAVGGLLLAAAVVLDAAGVVWMRRITQRAMAA